MIQYVIMNSHLRASSQMSIYYYLLISACTYIVLKMLSILTI